MSSPEQRLSPFAAVVFAAGCFASVWVSHQLTLRPTGYLLVFFLSGWITGHFLARPLRQWPVLVALAIPGAMLAEWLCHGDPVSGLASVASALTCGGVSAFVIRNLSSKVFDLTRVRHVFTFALATPFACIFSALIHAALYGHSAPYSFSFEQRWQLWWLAEVCGVLIVAPLALAWSRPQSLRRFTTGAGLSEGLLLAMVLLVLVDLVFGSTLWRLFNISFAHPYVLLTVLLWAAVRFGPRGISAMGVMLAVGVLWSVHFGGGAFPPPGTPLEQASLIQIFLASAQLFSLLPAAMIAERERVAALLNETSVFQRTLLNSANAAIFSFGPDGVLRSFNVGAEKLLGWSAAELLDRETPLCFLEKQGLEDMADHLSAILYRQIRANIEVCYALALEYSQHEIELALLHKDGSLVSAAVVISPLRDEKNAVTGYVGIARDLTYRKRTEAALRESESAVGSFFDASPMMLGIVELQGDDMIHISDNPAAARFAGISVEAMRGVRASEMPHMTKENRILWLQYYRQSAASGRPVQFQYTHETGKAECRLSATISPIQSARSSAQRFCYIIEDITEQTEALEEVRQFAAIIGATTDFIAIADRQGNFTYVNRAMRALAGLRPEDPLPAWKIQDFHPQASSEMVRHEGFPVAMLEGVWQGETVFSFRGGVEVITSQLLLALKDSRGAVEFIVIIARDITQQKDAEEQIRSSLREKEALVREIHHRVKNNMQVVSSLLGLQSGYIKDPVAKTVFDESRERIKTMALIHEKLYQSDDLGSVDFAEFLRSVVPMIFGAHNVRGATVRAKIETVPARFSLDTAIPLGLIVNELVSNCLKHAFNQRESGTVRVLLEARPEARFALIIGDDGPGMPVGLDLEKSGSLGLRLVRILTKQLKGTLQIHRENGTTFEMIFREI